jgi:hypothetical protein
MNTIHPELFTRIDNDRNGNPRCVIHFTDLIDESDEAKVASDFKEALESNPFERVNLLHTYAAHKYRSQGARKYHGRSYGGGVVFHGTPESVAAKLNRTNN